MFAAMTKVASFAIVTGVAIQANNLYVEVRLCPSWTAEQATPPAHHGTVAIAAVLIAVAGASTASGSSAKAGAAKPGEWPLPGADLQNTRNVPGPITSSNVATLKKAWTVPIRAAGTFGDVRHDADRRRRHRLHAGHQLQRVFDQPRRAAR